MGPTGTLIYAGIDEAGYGPLLGPLCVAQTIFRVREWSAEQGVPNLWERLADIVCEAPSQAGTGRLPVGDSKKLKLSNQSKTRHPLTHLERGVLSFLSTRGDVPVTDAALLEAIGTAPCPLPWYDSSPIDLPLSTTPDHISLLGARLRAACESADVELCDISCRVLDESSFNSRHEALGQKSRIVFELVAELIRRVWDDDALMCAGGQSDDGACAPRLVIDRQGGRRGYADLLDAVLPGARVISAMETERLSRYEVVEQSPERGAPVRRMVISFQVDAEQHHLPVALSSMTAKLARELSMMRFNRYWSGRMTELKPTAGYTTDGRRWLADVDAELSEFERASLPRRA